MRYLRIYISLLSLFLITHNNYSEQIDVDVKDSSTWVSIAKVYLEVKDMKYSKGFLTGDYDIKIPLFSKKNDNGKLQLQVDDVEVLRVKGGKLKGLGRSNIDGQEYPVICEIKPSNYESGKLALTIQTSNHTLDFDTYYKALN